MAVRARTTNRIEFFKDDAHVFLWTGLTQATLDSGDPVQMPGSADRSVQVLGTLGAAGSVRIEGSNVAAPTVDADWAVLTDPQGNALDISALKIEQVMEIPLWIRPRITAGDGTTSLSVLLLVRRPPT
jgi:hypothetical protein